MRVVVQKVSSASVKVDDEIVGAIEGGLLVLLGVGNDDDERDALYLLDKIIGLRVFDDANGAMNLSLLDTDGELLIVSQFTIYGDVRRGKRPSYSNAAPPETAKKLYEFFVGEARKRVAKVETGRFQAMMKVELTNEGPVTILLDSKKLF
ncbi:MAG: D-tyrosyl-tRNA(Tyr) deacylase [Pyrinomonadaceae bacterium]|nr:D-tyrosyl-tRNA(Tyr) deacylase [Pyrinomonadaceae bacterium]